MTFDNTPQAHKHLLKALTKGGWHVCVGLEATGLSSRKVALALHHHRRTHVMGVNPKAMSNDAHARMQRAKTDAMDAVMILDDAQRMPFVAWQPPSERVLQRQAVMRRVDQLTQAIIREHSRAHAQGYHINSTGLIARDMAVHIRHLKRRIPYLEDQALDLVMQDKVLRRAYQRLCSVTGIAQTSALRILAELALLPLPSPVLRLSPLASRLSPLASCIFGQARGPVPTIVIASRLSRLPAFASRLSPFASSVSRLPSPRFPLPASKIFARRIYPHADRARRCF